MCTIFEKRLQIPYNTVEASCWSFYSGCVYYTGVSLVDASGTCVVCMVFMQQEVGRK